MNRPDVDEVLNYLSIKFNKIFCDRDFVCCVIEDFQIIFNNKNKVCVLVFPTLGPIYLKALRYQARIFDLAVFNIASASGKFKSVAVCLKDHLKKAEQVKEEAMPEPVSKRKRPERQIYIPPAQRTSLVLKQCDKKVTSDLDCRKNTKSKKNNECDKCISDFESVLTLSDIVNLTYFFNTLPCGFRKLEKYSYSHNNCEFKKFLNYKCYDNSLQYNKTIKIYDNFLLLSDILWRVDHFKIVNTTPNCHFKSYPLYNFDSYEVRTEKPAAVLVSNEISHFEEYLIGLDEIENHLYKIECDTVCDQLENCKILDMAILDLGHFSIITMNGSEYFYECQENHDPTLCFKSVIQQLKTTQEMEKMKISTINNKQKEETNTNNKISSKTQDIVKNKINKNKKKDIDNKYEQEREIMRMTKEYMNRKTRPIMTYVNDSEENFRIDKDDGVNNWEDLFDDNGEIQEDFLTEIVDKVGDDITIVKANEDYSAYANKPREDLEHVVELYNFPATLETHDLVQAFSDINSDAMYIKWVDDTHALLVLGSLSQAQKAISMTNPLIKVRPMTAASAVAIDVANKSDLKPAMKRPPTNLQTARRLITSHLGTKSKLTKEQIAKEKQDLKNAKELKRLFKQSEKDAWEGNIRSSVN